MFDQGRYLGIDLMNRRITGPEGVVELVDEEDALASQWDATVRAVMGEGPVEVDGRAGWRAVELAERIGAAVGAR